MVRPLCLIAYRKSHHVHVTTEKQTVAFNIQARINFKSRRRARMGIWEAMEMLNTLVDESDPDVSFHVINSRCTSLTLCSLAPQTSLSQIEHLLQTAEAIRRDGKPEWMQVTGLVHDLGKLLFLFESEGQWDVVGVRHIQLARSPGMITLTPNSSPIGHIRRRLPFFRQEHIPRYLRGQPRFARQDLLDRIWHLPASLRSR